MATATSERDLAELLSVQLAGIATVRWGWKALETAELPPSLPLVTLQRSLASAEGYVDMCPQEGEPTVDTTILVHVWDQEYAAVRALNRQVRGIVLAAGGWTLQIENDDYDGVFRAWRITGQYLGAGMTAE